MPAERRIAITLRIDQPGHQHQGVISGVQRYARERGGWRCVFESNPAEPIGDPLETYDGVLLRGKQRVWPTLRKAGVPFVNTQHLLRKLAPEVPGVYSNTRRCGEIAADHLLARGFHRLAFVSNDFPRLTEIGEGFVATLEEAGRTCDVRQLRTGREGSSNYSAVFARDLKPLLAELIRPAAVLTVLPWTARLLVAAAENRGWDVPQDLAVMCVDNVPSVLEFPPEISCIDCGHEQIGYEAAAMLDRLMDDPASGPTQVLVPPKGIISRRSTDYFAVEDDVVAQALRFISDRLSEKLPVDRIADEVGVSRRALQRRFDRALGIGVSEEIRRLRIETAKRLLRSNEQMPTKQVARQTGFSSYITLNQAFHRAVGMSPTAYREQFV